MPEPTRDGLAQADAVVLFTDHNRARDARHFGGYVRKPVAWPGRHLEVMGFIRAAEADEPGLWGDEVTGPDCRRCHRSTVRCEVCKGNGKVSFTFGKCTECDGTGWVCPTDGKHWH